jgi:HlyD family secretion protein
MKWLLLLLILAGAATGGFYVWQRNRTNGDEVIFRTAPVEVGDLAATISSTGTIEPEEVIDVGAQVAGQIKNFGIDPNDSSRVIDYGTHVHPNTLLAQLDDALFKARVEQADGALAAADAQIAMALAGIAKAEADLIQYRAKVVQTERDWERAQQLKLTRNIAELDFDIARANYETARSSIGVAEAVLGQAKAAKIQAEKSRFQMEGNLHEAQVNLGYTQIRSPVEGVIVDRRVNVGQTVVAGLNAPSLFLIAKDLKRLQVWASVNEADIGNIHTGQSVRFTVDAFPNETFVGQVAQIRLNATMTQNVVTYTVLVNTDNSSGRLLPYMTAALQFEVARRNNVVLVPNAALRWKPRPTMVAPEYRKAAKHAKADKEGSDKATVWIQDGEFVRPVPVRTGLTDGVQTEILSGELEQGEPIVIGARRAAKADDASATPFAPKMFGGGAKKGG